MSDFQWPEKWRWKRSRKNGKRMNPSWPKRSWWIRPHSRGSSQALTTYWTIWRTLTSRPWVRCIERTTKFLDFYRSSTYCYWFTFFFIQPMMMRYLKNCCWGSTSWMSLAASLQRSRPWASRAGYRLFAFSTTLEVMWFSAVGCGLNHSLCNPVADPLWQAGEAAEHSGKEHSGWVEAFHYDEPRKRLLNCYTILSILMYCHYILLLILLLRWLFSSVLL